VVGISGLVACCIAALAGSLPLLACWTRLQDSLTLLLALLPLWTTLCLGVFAGCLAGWLAALACMLARLGGLLVFLGLLGWLAG
jgi:hypothetical protein